MFKKGDLVVRMDMYANIGLDTKPYVVRDAYLNMVELMTLEGSYVGTWRASRFELADQSIQSCPLLN